MMGPPSTSQSSAVPNALRRIVSFALSLSVFVLANLAAPAALFAAGMARDLATQPVRSLLEMRQDKVVMQKWDISCGAAALATVLNYEFGDAVSEKEIARSMLRGNNPARVKERMGFSLLDMKRFVEGRGYSAVGYRNITLDDLAQMGPTIVTVRVQGYSHFVIFRGSDGDRVRLADPAFGNRSMSVEAFETAWHENIGLVVKQRDDRASRNDVNRARTLDIPRVPGAVIRSVLH